MSPFSVSLAEVAGPQKALYKHATWDLITVIKTKNNAIFGMWASLNFSPELISISRDLSDTVIFVWREGRGVSLLSVFGCCSGRGGCFWGQFSALNCPQKNFCVGGFKGTGRVFTKVLKTSRRRVCRCRAPSYLPPVAKGGVRTSYRRRYVTVWAPVQNMHMTPQTQRGK